MTPEVSIIIPTYNRAQYICFAIESVLRQTYTDWELLVVDDGSIDNTEFVVQTYVQRDQRIVYVKQEQNQGISKTRNNGLQKAHGKYVAMLDSDDIWLDTQKLEKQLGYLEEQPSCVLVGTNIVHITDEGKEIKKRTFVSDDLTIRKKILLKNQFAQSSVLFLKEPAMALGGYREDISIGEDYDLWLRLGMKGKLANLSDFSVGYRIHNKSISQMKKVKTAFDTLGIIVRYRNLYPRSTVAIIFASLRIIRSFFL